ncbi:single-stranded-DNA-specific exonuclease RecJ [Marinospirillum alkaliphilum]|uniref:Single-stranded-DNA-specific exonuclease RecJ n=1 Tax=Marinospirillum alkaliphilum DSM 21637 TaxID=1122209 RepID=A0A1K1VXZ2_9GAMM|nr:single-stranded-DNA-specific exonuclease RecJ [Marinospirillum alkaliphilum]SFX29461.1 single-stranded-DNA-specific exonuclease [Marinospirillum alkaliphilum DSM 21637]
MSTEANAKPRLIQRPLNQGLYQQALAEGVHPLLARILAGRLQQVSVSPSALIEPGLNHLIAPEHLADLPLAVERLALAIHRQERIGILTDYDVDGITSHVVIYRTLTETCDLPAERISSLIGHRMVDGYGVSDPLVDRILASDPLPTLIITADGGSSDEPRLARLKAAGIDVIVTDHHALPVEGPPPSALAVINPTRKDCPYPDKTLAGCAVSWLLMSALRNHLVTTGVLPAATPKLSALLPFVALGTVADCVSLGGSPINRALIRAGLELMNASDAPCWQAYRQFMGDRHRSFTATTLGFQLGPRINARSRMADPYAALHYLLAEQQEAAAYQLQLLDSDNQDRRIVEATMVQDALKAAAEQVAAGHQSLVAYVEDGHSGVQGIVASRLVERYGRPAVVLTPGREPQHLSGSVRSVPGLHIRDALQRVDDLHPGMLVRFGGHQGAAGLTLWQHHLVDFQQALEKSVRFQLGARELQPQLFTDGELEARLLSLDTCRLLKRLEPYGREFEEPLFEGLFRIDNLQVIGNDQTHLRLDVSPVEDRISLKAIWFRALQPGAAPAFRIGDQVRLAYRLEENHFRNQVTLQLQVVHCQITAG